MRSAGIVHESADDSYGVSNAGRVATIADIREPTIDAYGTNFVPSPSKPDEGSLSEIAEV